MNKKMILILNILFVSNFYSQYFALANKLTCQNIFINKNININVINERRFESVVTYHTTLERDLIKKSLLHAEYTTENENLKWIDIAESTTKDSKLKLFVEIENSKLKTMNDTLKDKDLVTAIMNMHKQLFIEEMNTFINTHPNYIISRYSDFKSLRFAIEGEINPSLESELFKYFENAQLKFTHWVKLNKLVRESDEPSSWFKMGTGNLADHASSAARFARTQSNWLTGFSFNSPEVKKELTLRLQHTDDQRTLVIQELKNSPLSFLLTQTQNGYEILSIQAFDILRKAKNANEVVAKFSKTFGLSHFSDQVASDLLEYAKAVDQFSPSLYIGKREVATLDTAENGGFSIDFAGMGAFNLTSTAAALAGNLDLNTSLINARLGEKEVTSLFTKQRQKVKDVSESTIGKKLKTICSGDDCVGILSLSMTQKEKQNLINNFANQGFGANIRLAFIPSKIMEPEERTQLATHGESLEKYLRSHLDGVIDTKIQKAILFAVDMKTTRLNEGPVALMMSTPSDFRLSLSDLSSIQKAFQLAVDDLNKNLVGFSGYTFIEE